MGNYLENLTANLSHEYGREKADYFLKKYQDYLSSQQTELSIADVTRSIAYLENLSSTNKISLQLHQQDNKEKFIHISLYQYIDLIPLSEILPVFENMGLKTFQDHLQSIDLDGNTIWINKFRLQYKGHHEIKFNQNSDNSSFEAVVKAVISGKLANDRFNELALTASLQIREITILRAYAKYALQIRYRFSKLYIEETLTFNPHITKNLIRLFSARFAPDFNEEERAKLITIIENDIMKQLDQVTNSDQDNIIRFYLHLLLATIRTNYYQLDDNKMPLPYLSFKIDSKLIPMIPTPKPLYEIFVYSKEMEGIHLRSTKVSRGGIRWSERIEDYRTEILGLMKTQRVKNAVIVPSGAKGGFIVKTAINQSKTDSDTIVSCYKIFIRALLELTDNFINDKLSHPDYTKCYDDYDPYLVVAADKGTAAFSDIANELAIEKNFWLNDAFASGGRTGYNHKEMGITARGAWESVKRHFRELNINIENSDFTVVGIGDMSGDVFGNGMLQSKHIKLLAAFDHRAIFIDPNPDPEISYIERERLFKLPKSSWEDYNPELISAGGGIYKRSSKLIAISSQIRQWLNLSKDMIEPNELLREILKAPVDLLWNGGIGTFVKSIAESNESVSEKVNDFIRVNGIELKCRIVGEGGNLGFTQLGRVEYALHNGAIYTDSIDNSAGVDCSDHEVNIKILIDELVNQGKLSTNERNQMLRSLTVNIAELVIKDNYDQTLAVSLSTATANSQFDLYIEYIKFLESKGNLDRAGEFLPDEESLIQRKVLHKELTSPEISLLMSYTKLYIKGELLQGKFIDDPYLTKLLNNSFPEQINKAYPDQIKSHKLRRELIATNLSNRIVNEMGIIFIYEILQQTSADISEIAKAYLIVSEIYNTSNLRSTIISLDNKIEVKLQYDMFMKVQGMVARSLPRFINKPWAQISVSEAINYYRKHIDQLYVLIPELMSGATKSYLADLEDKLSRDGIAKHTARKIAACGAMYSALNIIEITNENDFKVDIVAKMYFLVGEHFDLVWFRDQLNVPHIESYWADMARVSLRNDLDTQQKNLTIQIINHTDPNEQQIETRIQAWMQNNQLLMKRWNDVLTNLHAVNKVDFVMLFVAVKELAKQTSQL